MDCRFRFVAFATTALFATLPGCFVFDPVLYQRHVDSGVEGGTDGGSDAARDGSAADALPVLVAADQCQQTLPIVTSGSSALMLDTRTLSDDFRELALCTGAEQRGNDGFVAFDTAAGDRWHFHVRVTDTTSNPSVYILPSCDERSCAPAAGLDECGAGRDEHMSFVAPTSGRYIVGVDSREPGGALFQVIAVRPKCGNGIVEHSESCDPGADGGVSNGCDPHCRSLLNTNAMEIEPNDDSLSANVLVTKTPPEPITVKARLGARCDFDTVMFNVPADMSVKATLLDSRGEPCGANTPGLRVTLLQSDGRTAVGVGTVSPGNSCPGITKDHAFAQKLLAGAYFLRTTTLRDETIPIDYQLRVEVGP